MNFDNIFSRWDTGSTELTIIPGVQGKGENLEFSVARDFFFFLLVHLNKIEFELPISSVFSSNNLIAEVQLSLKSYLFSNHLSKIISE